MPSVWKEFNNNPTGRRGVGDCAVRAVSIALGVSWETAYLKIVIAGFNMGDMPSSNSVWGAVLRQNGLYKHVLPNNYSYNYTFGDFVVDHPEGIYVLGTGTHVATVVDGTLLDAWDSQDELLSYYWSKNAEER